MKQDEPITPDDLDAFITRWRWSDLFSDEKKDLSFAALRSHLAKHDIPVSFEVLKSYFKSYYPQPSLCPPEVTEFIAEIASTQEVAGVLDLWAGAGTLIVPLSAAFPNAKAVGVCQTQEEVDVALSLEGADRVEWKLASPNTIRALETSDLVVACPRPSGRLQDWEIGRSGRKVRIRDTFENALMAVGGTKISENGLGCFVVRRDVLMRTGRKRVMSVLSDLDLYLDSYIGIPADLNTNVLLSGLNTAVPAALLLVRRSRPERVFVADLPRTPDIRRRVVDNLLKRSDTGGVALGTLVEKTRLRSFRHIAAQERLEDLAGRAGLKGVASEVLLKEINLLRSGSESEFEDKPHCAYLPLIGPSPAVSALPELKLKKHNYAQLVVDPAFADHRYLAASLNTPLGHAVRQSLMTGDFIPKITKTLLARTTFYLPDRQSQESAVSVDAQIREAATTLSQLQDRVWARPADWPEVSLIVSRYRQAEDFDSWIERLPFPLASILRAYDASDDVRQKLDHLDHFFEAMAEFLACVLLSAFQNEPDVFKLENVGLRETLQEQHLSIQRPSFGVWVVIAERLSKTARRMIGSRGEGPDTCRRMFRVADDDLILTLASKTNIAVFQQANHYRNLWRGHGGVVGHDEALRRLGILTEELLVKVREALGNTWERYPLITTESGLDFVDERFRVRSKIVMGPTTPFKTEVMEVVEPLEKSRLYLIGLGERRGLKLLPLVRLSASPQAAKNACYFYNRRENGHCRYVSYHFEPVPEIEVESSEILTSLAWADQ